MPLLQSARGSLVQIPAGQGCRVCGEYLLETCKPIFMYWKTHRVFFLTLNPPYSLLITLKYCFLHVQLCGCWRLRPQRSGSRRHVHNCRGSCPPPGFTSTIGVHIHHQGSCPPSGFMSTPGVHVHCRGSCPPSGFTSTIGVHIHCHPCRDDQKRRSEGLAFNSPDVAGFQPGALMPGRLLRHPNKHAGNAVLRNRGCQAQGLSKWDHHQGAEDTTRKTLFCPSLFFLS